MSPYTDKYIRQLNLQRRIFLTINIVAAVSLGIMFYFIHNQNDRIQDERRMSIIRSCRDTNMRHDQAVTTLNDLISKLPPDRQDAAQQSVANTILLINALVPVQDCRALAIANVNTH